MALPTTRREIFPGTVARPVAIITPAMDAKQAAYVLKGTTPADLVQSRRNLAPISKAALGTLRGAPIQNAAFMSFDSDVTAINTGVAETADVTLLVCFRRTPGALGATSSLTFAPMALSNVENTGGGQRGVGIGIVMSSATTGALRGVSSYNDVNGNPAATNQALSIGSNIDVWRIASLVVTAAGTTMRDHTTGLIANLAAATAVRAIGASPLLVGGAHTTYGGNCDVAAVAAWSRALSLSELNSEAAAMQARAALQGVAVTLV